jgi:hypothetical protein
MQMATRKNTPKVRAESAAVADKDLDQILRQFDAQPAPFTREVCDELEAQFTDVDSARCRRTALATLTRSGLELIEAVSDKEGAATFTEAQELVLDYSRRLREFADLMASASARIGIALCSAPEART